MNITCRPTRRTLTWTCGFIGLLVISGALWVRFWGLADPPEALRVLVLKDSPAMSYRSDQGELIGLNVELARLLCEHVKRPCDIQEALLPEVIDQIASGQADFSTVSLIPTDERRQRVDFTQAVRHNRSVWMGRHAIDKSAQFRVAVVAGSVQQQWAQRAASERAWTLVPLSVPADVGAAMQQGHIDAAIVPYPTSLSLVKERKLAPAGFTTLDAMEDQTLSSRSALAVRPGDKTLLNALNRALDDMRIAGQIDRLEDKYLSLRMPLSSL